MTHTNVISAFHLTRLKSISIMLKTTKTSNLRTSQGFQSFAFQSSFQLFSISRYLHANMDELQKINMSDVWWVQRLHFHRHGQPLFTSAWNVYLHPNQHSSAANRESRKASTPKSFPLPADSAFINRSDYRNYLNSNWGRRSSTAERCLSRILCLFSP